MMCVLYAYCEVGTEYLNVINKKIVHRTSLAFVVIKVFMQVTAVNLCAYSTVSRYETKNEILLTGSSHSTDSVITVF